MAIQPRDNETFYREVDEELRKEQLGGLWKRYGPLVTIALLLLLAALGGYLFWKNQQAERAGQRGEALVSAFDDVQAGKAKQAVPKLEQIAKEGDPGYRAAALLTKADIALQEGNNQAAVATFRQVANDGDIAEPYRQLALIRQTTVEFDRLPPAEVVRRLQPMAQAGNPWFGSAGELVALAHLKQKQPQRAAPIFAALAKDETLPSSIRSRAMQMAGALGIDATTDAAGATKGTAATKEATQ
ncbi:MAG TPA: tetratricopeptide repeat protein [Sphingomicrobium sp.]|nr:tetratricopeptide repeat protein [Sphingomicrobium sp.]